MISILGHVKMPNGAEVANNSNTSDPSLSKENFDSYFSKLQTICTDNMNDDVKPVCDSSSSNAAKAAFSYNPTINTSSSSLTSASSQMITTTSTGPLGVGDLSNPPSATAPASTPVASTPVV